MNLAMFHRDQTEQIFNLERASDCSFDSKDLKEMDDIKELNWSSIEEANASGMTRGLQAHRR